MLIPWDSLSFALYAVSAILVCVIAVAAWRRAQLPSSLRYSSLLLATVLVAPHLTVYDLVILAPVFLLIADWGAVQSRESRGYFGILLCLVYLLPLLGPLARFSHVQFAVPIMSGLLWKIRDQGRSAKELSTQGAQRITR
jgi:NADH:ubiquinone oxidoreductase subunit 4 (subunit M)